MKNKTIFLDRDGVINKLVYHKEEGIIDTPFSESQFEIVNSVPQTISKLRNAGYKIIIISNQPGIAKKYYSSKTFEKICKKMHQELEKKKGMVDDEFYCFHHPDAKNPKFKKKCSCRKPKIGLIKKAARIHNIDIKNSYFVGDGIVDLQAAKKAGCKSIFVGNMSSGLSAILKEKKLKPVYIAHDLKEASKFILQNNLLK
ncbi:MAG: HAD family hydrolase [Patescibacteria group bacterium]|nr:HAD family hydrolase [Patescibacteria group bacterium]